MPESNDNPVLPPAAIVGDFILAVEVELQRMETEDTKAKECRWHAVLGNHWQEVAANRKIALSLFSSESASVREVVVDILASFHWCETVQGLLEYAGIFDPELPVRCACLEALDERNENTAEVHFLTYMSQVVLRSSCHETARLAFVQLVYSLPIPQQEKDRLATLEYAEIHLDFVRPYWPLDDPIGDNTIL